MKPLELFHDLVKTTKNERGRLLGLDVGDKYVGLALSDFDNKIASPFRYYHNHHQNHFFIDWVHETWFYLSCTQPV